jgi:hypothetical protein
MLCGSVLSRDLYMYLCQNLSSLAGGSVLSHDFDLVVAQSAVTAVPQSGALRPKVERQQNRYLFIF